MDHLQRLAITCGGTGGHFYPGLSLARHFQGAGGTVTLILSGKNSVRQAEQARAAGISAVVLHVMPSPNWRHPMSVFKFFRGAAAGFFEARKFLKTFQPQALLGMGSFASAPAILAAKWCGVPLFLHDGNARIGKANRIFSRWARHLGTAFPPVNARRARCAVSAVGMPLRPELTRDLPDKAAAVASLNAQFKARLDPGCPTVLIFGGSQGARTVNAGFQNALLRIKARFQVLHLSGPREFERVSAGWAAAEFPVLTLPYLEDMRLAYAAADLVIARAGGSSVAEIMNFGKYALVAPYPFAAEAHQADNAAFLAASGGGRVISDADLKNGDNAQVLLEDFFANQADRLAAGRAARERHLAAAAARELAIIAENC